MEVTERNKLIKVVEKYLYEGASEDLLTNQLAKARKEAIDGDS